MLCEMMKKHGVVVLAAGKGTRMNSRVPKVLHQICGREMVSLVVDTAMAVGLGPIAVVVPSEFEAIQKTLSENVRYSVQSQPLGTGHALLQARSVMADVDNICVLSGDVPLVKSETLNSLVKTHFDRDSLITILTATSSTPEGLGRVVRNSSGEITNVVEEMDIDEGTRNIFEINAGIYCFQSSWLWANLETLKTSPNGEILLTDLISTAALQGRAAESVKAEDPEEALGVNTLLQLSQAEAILRQRILERWMLDGVEIRDPATAYIDFDVELGHDTKVLPNTHIKGISRIGSESEIGPDTTIDASTIGDRCKIISSTVSASVLEEGVGVGPYSNIRQGSHLKNGVHIGSYVEIKASRIGKGTKSGHFSYIGDADVGSNVNIGAGTVTCNYDGVRKNHTRIEDNAFIGSNTMLVAPVTVGTNASTGAGAVVTKDVKPGSQVLGVPARTRGDLTSKKNMDKGYDS